MGHIPNTKIINGYRKSDLNEHLMDSELCHFILCPIAIYVTEVDSYIYLIFMIYKAPDVQSTNVKHDSSMAVICLENIR